MTDESEQTDPAAVFGSALSLWREKPARAPEYANLSECYNGGDEFMRVVMRVATRFEEWASLHIAFEDIDDVWPYLLEDKFGAACATVVGMESLDNFDDRDCLRVALHLRLPVRHCFGLPVPVCVTATNPIPASPFVAFRIQTVREAPEGHACEPFTFADAPFDDRLNPPFFALYGVGSDNFLEHIADRATYAEALSLAQKIAPGVQFPSSAIPGPAS